MKKIVFLIMITCPLYAGKKQSRLACLKMRKHEVVERRTKSDAVLDTIGTGVDTTISAAHACKQIGSAIGVPALMFGYWYYFSNI